jgi:hypothetical protein
VTVTIVAMEVSYAPYTRSESSAPLTVPTRSGKSQHARGRRYCPNPGAHQHRRHCSGSSWLPVGYSFDLIPPDAQVQLSLTVDEKGQPQNIHVVKSFSPFIDARVIDSVSQFHFRPGTIDNQPVAIDLNLTVNVAR